MGITTQLLAGCPQKRYILILDDLAVLASWPGPSGPLQGEHHVILSSSSVNVRYRRTHENAGGQKNADPCDDRRMDMILSQSELEQFDELLKPLLK